MRTAHARRTFGAGRGLAAAALMLLTAGTLGAGGCAFRSSADSERGAGLALGPQEPPGSELPRWPERYTADFTPAIAGATDRLMDFNAVITPGVGLVEVEDKLIATVTRVAPYGQGVIRELDRQDSARRRTARLVPPAEFFSFYSPEQAIETLADRRMWRIGFREGRLEVGVQGTRVEYFHALAADGTERTQPARGLIVHLGSLGGRDYEMPVLEAMRRHGWAVVRMNASTAWERQPRVPVSAGDLSKGAERLAEMIDDRLAEIAYASEAAVAWLADQHPEVPTTNLAVMGFSAGALAAPATAVRLGDRVRAMILIGAGANILDVSQTSSLTNGGIRLEWPGGKRDETLWSELNRLYLERSSLDPYDLAPRLVGTPTLMLHGWFDEIVPARTGTLMWERLGRPDRWSFPLGHKGLFWRLPEYSDEIADWVDEAMPKADLGLGAESGSAPH